MLFETYEFLEQGGWPMIPLGLCSLAALTVILERFFSLRHGRVITPRLVDLLALYQTGSTVEPVLQVCRRSRGAFARIIETLLDGGRVDRAHAVEIMSSAGRKQVGRLDRGLMVLEIVAGISPLIGLLGTVLGMVTVFDAIALEGLGNAQVLSEGISKALVTTVGGLCVAIPALAFHSIFSRRVESLAVEMQDLATGFLSKLYGPGGGNPNLDLAGAHMADHDDVAGQFVGKLR